MSIFRKILIVCGLTVSFFFFLALFIVAIGIWNQLNEISFEETEHHFSRNYKYLDFDPTTNETSYGMVTLPQELEAGEYISYQNSETSGHSLISNFGSKEFKCTGSCFCGETRRNSIAVSRGIMYLLAASSSFLAYTLAKDYFDKECTKIMSKDEICHFSAIESDVEQCDRIGGYWLREGRDPSLREGRGFRCSGSCLPRKGVEEHYLKERISNYDCEGMKTDEYVEIHAEQPEYKLTYDDALKQAKHQFQLHLNFFCRRYSVEEETWNFENVNKEEETQQKHEEETQDEVENQQELEEETWNLEEHLCVGRYSDEKNPSVNCITQE